MLDAASKIWPILVGATMSIATISITGYEVNELNEKVNKIDSYQKAQYGWIKDIQAVDLKQDAALERAGHDLEKFSQALDRNTDAVNKLTTVVAVLGEKVTKQ